jgi:hypothetical protein
MTPSSQQPTVAADELLARETKAFSMRQLEPEFLVLPPQGLKK